MFAHGKKDIMTIDVPENTRFQSFCTEINPSLNLIIPSDNFINVTLSIPSITPNDYSQHLNIAVTRNSRAKTLNHIGSMFKDDSLELDNTTTGIQEVSSRSTEFSDETPALKKEFITYYNMKEKEKIMILCALKYGKVMRFRYSDSLERYKDGISNVLKVINSVKFVNKKESK